MQKIQGFLGLGLGFKVWGCGFRDQASSDQAPNASLSRKYCWKLSIPTWTRMLENYTSLVWTRTAPIPSLGHDGQSVSHFCGDQASSDQAPNALVECDQIPDYPPSNVLLVRHRNCRVWGLGLGLWIQGFLLMGMLLMTMQNQISKFLDLFVIRVLY